MLARNALAVTGPACAFHQAAAGGIFARGFGNGFVVLGYLGVESVGVGQQVADALVGVAGQVFEMFSDVAAQAGNFLWEDDAEFGDQAAQAVVGGGALSDEALPGAVQA